MTAVLIVAAGSGARSSAQDFTPTKGNIYPSRASLNAVRGATAYCSFAQPTSFEEVFAKK